MKNLAFFFLAFLSFQVNAQSELTFNKLFVECIDRWVAFPVNEDGTYSYGFIYFDSEAGLTFNSEGTFRPESGRYEVRKNEKANIKFRLEPQDSKAAIIPEEMYKELQVEVEPEWLKYYKKDMSSVRSQYNLGYMYNAWNQCARALEHLEKANELNPDFKGLAVELAFSYNCLNNYDKAAEILEEAIVKHPTDAYINKELIYSLTKNKSAEKAAKQFYAFTKGEHDQTHDAENAFNIMQYHYINKDKKNFGIWYKELKKWPNKDEHITKYAEMMKNEL